MEYITPSAPQQGLVLCADCGTPITPNNANLCLSCLRASVDITEGIPKQATVNFCRNCERYLNPPLSWVPAQLESRELLAICLKKLKGLNKVRLIDASFIWTEPHSKRLRVKLTVQKEVLTSTILQQIFEIEFVVQYGQCPDCTRLAAQNTWRAQIQVRQKVPHKRTFLLIEQMILKHNAHKETISIEEKKDGLNFYYAQRSHAVKMCDFLASIAPIRMQSSATIISADVHTSTQNNKFTYSVEIAPICKDELVVLPKRMAKSMGSIGQLVICYRVLNNIRLVDPTTLQVADVTGDKFFRDPFESLCQIPEMIEFLVLDIEPSGLVSPDGKWMTADAQVSPLNATSFGEADAVFHTRTHLGTVLQPGDTVMGYHLSRSNLNSDAWETIPEERRPDVVLIKKSYPNNKKRKNKRTWRLKSIAKAEGEAPDEGKAAIGRRGGLDGQRVERDYELFLQALEEDEELRAGVNLYRDPEAEERLRRRREQKARWKARQVAKAAAMAQAGEDEVMDEAPVQLDGATDEEEFDDGMTDDGFTSDGESEFGDHAPQVPIDELLDDLDNLELDDAEQQ
jgi:nonsense-mediated mRNA decay protein 3